MNHIAVLVAQDLDFDVAGREDELLNKNPVVTKRIFRFGLYSWKAFLNIFLVISHSNAFAAATGAGFDHNRITNLARDFDRVGGVVNLANVARNARNASGGSRLLALNFVAHRMDSVWVWPDKDYAFICTALSKLNLLRQKAKAWIL
jgi:hypothetical protein